MTLQDFLELRRFINIAHHVPGRVRLKFDPRILESQVFNALAPLAKAHNNPEILNARLNPLARSLIIEYDRQHIKPEELNEFLTSPDLKRLGKLAHTMAKLFGVRIEPD